MAILEHFSTDNGVNDYLKGTVQLDYFFMGADNLMIDTYAFRPYFGVNVGAMDIDLDSESGVKTITYGAQLGATMNLTQQIDLDLGLRYNLAGDERVDHTSNISAGIHYKY
jgi:opacity protein-like surface antigen